mmetsp:Transcript_53321/g.124120  ORF Transcript_53321/g.124120 Transcript_53321/m.124120 type:complete len:242 (+) Transcript_53321:528-1253(+)
MLHTSTPVHEDLSTIGALKLVLERRVVLHQAPRDLGLHGGWHRYGLQRLDVWPATASGVALCRGLMRKPEGRCFAELSLRTRRRALNDIDERLHRTLGLLILPEQDLLPLGVDRPLLQQRVQQLAAHLVHKLDGRAPRHMMREEEPRDVLLDAQACQRCARALGITTGTRLEAKHHVQLRRAERHQRVDDLLGRQEGDLVHADGPVGFSERQVGGHARKRFRAEGNLWVCDVACEAQGILL